MVIRLVGANTNKLRLQNRSFTRNNSKRLHQSLGKLSLSNNPPRNRRILLTNSKLPAITLLNKEKRGSLAFIVTFQLLQLQGNSSNITPAQLRNLPDRHLLARREKQRLNLVHNIFHFEPESIKRHKF